MVCDELGNVEGGLQLAGGGVPAGYLSEEQSDAALDVLRIGLDKFGYNPADLVGWVDAGQNCTHLCPACVVTFMKLELDEMTDKLGCRTKAVAEEESEIAKELTPP